MPDTFDLVATDAGGQRERPFLYPWNRRLRHLQGISIRNLDISPPVERPRGRTIADDDIPYKSPTKRIKDDVKTLQHSRSSSDLISPLKKHTLGLAKASTSYVKDDPSVVRPSGHRLRRRSTLHFAGASPIARQRKLEDVAADRMADTWFSIHSQDRTITEPLYISEVMEESMNPSFRFFDLNALGPQITRSDELRLMIWAKSWRVEEYQLLIELNVNLRSLQFIGRSLENFHHPLPSNCILFHLSDGIYTSFTDMPMSSKDYNTLQAAAARSGEKDTTSSYDALMQLANLDDCIQDALLTRQKMEKSITSILSKHQSDLDLTKRNVAAQEAANLAERAVGTERKNIRHLESRIESLRTKIQLRREVIASSRAEREAQEQLASDLSMESSLLKSQLATSHDAATGQIRRIAETLSMIFPIEPIKPPSKALAFSIRSLPLPNSTFDSTNRDSLAAALGFTAQLVHQLSLYLSAPLPYPITPHGSDSTISDPISVGLAATQRVFPLYPVSVKYKFEYGVFLLNKDVEVLMSKVGLRVLDIRHTLPNLMYTLYVLTAGTGEMPARKAGGVKGLMGGHGRRMGSLSMRGSPSVSRRGSSESVNSESSYVRAVGAAGANGGVPIPNSTEQGKEKEREKRIVDPDDPFISTSPRGGGAKMTPFRSSLLREAH